MDIATLHVEEHEIAKADDFEFGFLSVIKNTALLDRMLVSAETDYVVGGMVNAVPGTMEVTVEALWANGKTLENPVFRDEVSLPVTITRPLEFPRMDIIQVRSVLEQYDYQRRAFHNPELEHGQFFMMNTKTRLALEIAVKQGVEGDEHAPAADAGYVKLAEVLTDPEMTGLMPEHIRNITAIHQGEPRACSHYQKVTLFLGGPGGL